MYYRFIASILDNYESLQTSYIHPKPSGSAGYNKSDVNQGTDFYVTFCFYIRIFEAALWRKKISVIGIIGIYLTISKTSLQTTAIIPGVVFKCIWHGLLIWFF